MSIFHCNGCDKYVDPDKEGYHEMDCGVYFCDTCESNTHMDEYLESMEQLKSLLKE